MFLHDDNTGKECIEESECSAMGLVTFVTDQNEKLCIPLDQCLLKGGYFLTTEKGKICVNAAACSSEHNMYAYAAAGECGSKIPASDGHFNVQDNVYKCDTSYPYLDTSGANAKCVYAKECIDNENLLYVSDDGKQHSCVSSTECQKMGYLLRI